jgi:hypothetical protein
MYLLERILFRMAKPPPVGDPIVDAGVIAFLNTSTGNPAPPAGSPAGAAVTVTAARPVQANDHFLFPEPLPKLPWEMDLEERRRASKDPRIMKQIREEDEWLGTSCSGLWKLFRTYAKPIADWKINHEQLTLCFTTLGVRSATFANRVIEVFDPNFAGSVNALIICKIFSILLDATHEYCDFFVRHCYDRFDRISMEDCIRKKTIMTADLRPPEDAVLNAGKKKKKKKGDTDPRLATMVSGATYDNVRAFKELLPTVITVDDTRVEYAEFKVFFLDPKNGDFVGTFAVALFEAAVKYCAPPYGRLPTIPLRWLNLIEPLPFSPVMHDADIALLKEIEITGIDPRAQKDKKKKRSASTSSKGKK